MHSTAYITTPIGLLRAAADEDALTELTFSADSAASRGGNEAPLIRRLRSELAAYFDGTLTSFSIPLKPSGTEFQKAVWQALTKIPYGTTRSYIDIARAVGRPKAARAVGQANGANPIVIIVPCHRVINAAQGNAARLGGYSSGLDKKAALLKLEGAIAGFQKAPQGEQL